MGSKSEIPLLKKMDVLFFVRGGGEGIMPGQVRGNSCSTMAKYLSKEKRQ